MAKRGRPTLHPTKEERQKVKELVASDAPTTDIAKILGRSVPTLKKHFRKELFSENKSRRAEKKPPNAMPYKITKVHRDKVVRYIGSKETVQTVAYALDCSVEQLEANFKMEIEKGKAKARAKVLDSLFELMEDGNAVATNRLEAITAAPDAAAPTGAHIGKKAAAVAAAHAAAGGHNPFAPPPPPLKLVSNNDK